MHAAKREVKEAIRREGKVKLSRVPHREIIAMARARLFEELVRRMRAAMAALQHEHPKLTAMAIDSMDGASFAAMFDKAIARSQAPPKMIEHRPGETAPSVKWSGPKWLVWASINLLQEME
jgi:hypothetical protein